jgi:hypothetical protein
MRLAIRPILRDTFVVYRRHWRLLIPVAFVVLLPQALVDTGLGDVEVDRVESVGDVLGLAVVPLAIAVGLGGEALYAGVVAAAVLQWRAGHDVRIDALARSLPYGRLIVADVLLAVGIAAGIALLVVPGVVFATYYALTPALIKLEGRTVRGGFRRSRELVSGSFWPVLALIAGVLVGTEVASELLALPFHQFAAELVEHLAVEALLEPVQGLVTVLTVLALLELRGEHEPVLARGVHA